MAWPLDRFLPLDGGGWRLRVGTRRVPVGEWLWGIGPGAAADLDRRAGLVAAHADEVLAALPNEGVAALRRLPATGCAVFAIHTAQRRLDALGGAERQALAAALATIPPEVAAYKGITACLPAVSAWLAGAVGRGEDAGAPPATPSIGETT